MCGFIPWCGFASYSNFAREVVRQLAACHFDLIGESAIYSSWFEVFCACFPYVLTGLD